MSFYRLTVDGDAAGIFRADDAQEVITSWEEITGLAGDEDYVPATVYQSAGAEDTWVDASGSVEITIIEVTDARTGKTL